MSIFATNEQNPIAVIDAIRKGINKSDVVEVFENLDIPVSHVGNFLSVSYRTFLRKADDEKMTKQDTEMVFKLHQMRKKGEDLFGDNDAFISWLNTELQTFGDRKPIELIDTEYGIDLVTTELGRIEHGIFG